jgi:tRNA pseudouridine55 synthase
MNGFLVLDKPAGPSSFQQAEAVARTLGARRFGHGGTLDPQASGVLPVCLGEATKLASYLLAGDKEYEAEIRIGIATDTLDAAGAVTATCDASAIAADAVRAALLRMVGTQSQTPPMYSALWKDGRRLYELARAGVAVERPSREVCVHETELLSFVPGAIAHARARISCSKGTYIRVLAADLGIALGACASLSALRRTRSGPFTIAQAVAPAEVTREHVLPLEAALCDLPRATVPPRLVVRVRNGAPLSAADVNAAAAGRLALVSESGALLALAEATREGTIRYLRGFAPTGD